MRIIIKHPFAFIKFHLILILISVTFVTVAFASGDIDGNGTIDLKDAILSLQISTGSASTGVDSAEDINNDEKIGLEEAIYVLNAITSVNTTNSITQFGITWTFDKKYPYGRFANGDYWVIGPVNITGITNDWHVHGFLPEQGRDGSMINPSCNNKQGYDNTLSSYESTLNVSYPNGMAISPGNPLVLNIDRSLISTVSWLYNSESDTEPGCPVFNGGTHTPVPVLRDGAILTCLNSIPLEGSFRPPYAGSDKTVKFNVDRLDYSLLMNLSPVPDTVPDIASVQRDFERPWIDHVNQYLGAYIHPSENMPHYGREMSKKIGDASLMLHLDFSQLSGNPSRTILVIEFVQLGIDLAGIADAGGSWPPNGGWLMGRKWPILFAGVMLNDEHMKNVGNWTTLFQEDADTFYVSMAEVNMTHSGAWTPDTRGGTPVPYEIPDIGLPEWGILHATQPAYDNKLWATAYRGINGVSYGGFVLAAHIMGQKTTWNHDALFDYEDRWWGITGGDQYPQSSTPFTKDMWNTYRADYPPIWSP